MLRAATLSRMPDDPREERSETPDVIGRIEAWVASYLDGQDGPTGFSNLQDWQQHAIHLFNPRPTRTDRKAREAEPTSGWKRVSISRKHGATIIKLLDQTLVKESDIVEFAEELLDLIDAGHHRVVLDFAHAERVSCGIVPTLAEAARRCRDAGQGELRLLNLRPELAPMLGLCPQASGVRVPGDEASAVDGPWPGGNAPRALPEALLAGFVTPRTSALVPPGPEADGPMLDSSKAAHRDAIATSLVLVVQTGSARGRVVPIGERVLTIGRDPSCQIRSDHAMLSRRHAEVRTLSGRAVIRDLGSTNGTLRNGEPVGTGPTPLCAGDRLEVGPLKFRVVPDPRCRPKAINEEEIVHWLGPEAEVDGFGLGEDTVYDVPATNTPLKMQVIEGVLIVTPLDPTLLSGPDVSVFRDELGALLEAHSPHRVVINLKLVARISNAAVGLLVAHHVRLDRLGGALRLCEPHARVAEVLNQIRLPLLLDVYPTEDEAVLSKWDRPAA